MKKTIAYLFCPFLFLLCTLLAGGFLSPCWANEENAYIALDATDPVVYLGDRVIYGGVEYVLGPKTLYVDGLLSDEEVRLHPYVYNSALTALSDVTAGSEAEPMTILLAPYVYWMDDPDDPEVRRPAEGQKVPFAVTVDCPWLRLQGLTKNPENVVLAVNRGQAQGSYGNFTLMDYHGDGLQLYNITIGNYCNIDLEYPLRPSMNRARRMESITQAQLIFAYGDKNEAHNCRFLSRLNLNPIFGAKRTLFDGCYFEMTDDSLCKSGVYLNCRFGFFSSFPFGSSQPIGGAVFLNCDIDVYTPKEQYLVKVCRGPFTLVDVRYHCDHPVYIGWSKDLLPERKFYQHNVSLNGKQLLVEEKHPEVTVVMDGKPVLDAYKLVTDDGRVIYNTYNLLAGYDDWDPMHVKADILALEAKRNKALHDLPVYLSLETVCDTIEAGKSPRSVQAIARRHSDFDGLMPALQWTSDQSMLTTEGDNSQRLMRSVNTTDTATTTMLHVSSVFGLEASRRIVATPHIDHAPAFQSLPSLVFDKRHHLKLDYSLSLPDGRRDESLINWYRCTSPHGDNPVLVKVTRLGCPQRLYSLSPDDLGYYIMAEISPCHNLSKVGTPVRVVTDRMITERLVNHPKSLDTDFGDFPIEQQPMIKPGFWTVDGYKPLDTSYYIWEADTIANWTYDYGLNGAKDYRGLWQTAKGARLMYWPADEKLGDDMTVVLHAAPAKTSAQGFSSPTGQYMDICIKFDAQTLTGYALRVIRTTKYHNAVDFYLVKYDHGQISQISEAVSALCFMPDCTLRVETKGNVLSARVSTTADMRTTDDPALKQEVTLQAVMDSPSPYHGFALQHTGSGRSGASVLTHLHIDWK